MSSESEISVSPSGEKERATASAESSGMPGNWKEALVCLVSSRVAIMRAESKYAVGTGARKGALIAVAAVCVLFTWILLLAGSIGSISASSGWEWYHVSFAAAGVHFAIGLLAILLARSRSAAVFPVTRAEFEKDREWLNQITKKPK